MFVLVICDIGKFFRKMNNGTFKDLVQGIFELKKTRRYWSMVLMVKKKIFYYSPISNAVCNHLKLAKYPSLFPIFTFLGELDYMLRIGYVFIFIQLTTYLKQVKQLMTVPLLN